MTASHSVGAQTSPVPGWSLGPQLRGGVAITGQPRDEPGDVTLLYGSGYLGSALAVTGVARRTLHPNVSLQLELGVGSYQLRGFAERGEERRELVLSHVSLELGALAQASAWLDRVELFAGLGVAPRIGLAANLRDAYSGSTAPDVAPAAATSVAFPFVAELGVALGPGNVRIPIALRAAWNVAYPDRTLDRLSGWTTFDDRGTYAVEHDVDVLLTVGINIPVGRPR